MADAVTTQVLMDGERLFIGKYTNLSDGTGESKVTKIDVSGLARSDDNFPCNGIKINKIWCQTSGMAVDLYWVGDPTPANDAIIVTLAEDQLYDVPYDTFGGIPSNATGTANAAGDVAVSTRGAASGDGYTLIIEGIKTYGAIA